jgi:hypothetical protein
MRPRRSARQAVLAQTWTAAAQVVETIEPPSWWVERDEQELLLLIEGSGLDGAEVRVAHGPITVARIEPESRKKCPDAQSARMLGPWSPAEAPQCVEGSNLAVRIENDRLLALWGRVRQEA